MISIHDKINLTDNYGFTLSSCPGHLSGHFLSTLDNGHRIGGASQIRVVNKGNESNLINHRRIPLSSVNTETVS